MYQTVAGLDHIQPALDVRKEQQHPPGHWREFTALYQQCLFSIDTTLDKSCRAARMRLFLHLIIAQYCLTI